MKHFSWIALLICTTFIFTVFVSTTNRQSESEETVSEAKPFFISPKVKMIRKKDWKPQPATQPFYPVKTIGNPQDKPENTEDEGKALHFEPQPNVIIRDNPNTIDFSKNRSFEGLVIERRADGTHRVNLQGRFQHVMVARIAEDGSVVVECTDHPHQLTHNHEE